MAAYDYSLLDVAAEDALHKDRLLKVEVRPFERVARKILGRDSLLYAPRTALPTPPPDANDAAEDATAHEALLAKQAEDRRIWREDMLLDFAALEDSMVRIQLLRRSNEAERERYAAEKVKILETAQAIRANTASLHVQLDEAQKALALRKTYDALAERITSNRMLKPREEQHAQLSKLAKEIADLEEENKAYAQTWAERRTQFQRIVDEGKQMLRMIRDEKEEAERKEGMEENNSEAGSRAATPTPDAGSQTPAQTSQDAGAAPSRSLLKDLLAPEAMGGKDSRASSPGRQTPAVATPRSREVSPDRSFVDQTDIREASSAEEGEDAEMGEAGEVDDAPAVVDVEAGIAMEAEGTEDAEAGQDTSNEGLEKMEVT